MSSTPSPFAFGEPRPNEVRLHESALENAAGAESALRSDLDALESDRRSFAQKQYKTPPPPPGAAPYRMRLADILGTDRSDAIAQYGKFLFHAVGDTGQHGHGAAAQESVAFHMEGQVKQLGLPALDKPSLFYHLGDVVYYNGELKEYPAQFYDPYQHYPAPIVAIPGNHDSDNVPSEKSLASFVQNFCAAEPQTPPMPGQSLRRTMTQPNYYFTLDAPFLTIIGLYSNNTGDLDDPAEDAVTPQFEWFVQELREADPDKFLAVAVHHPPFSADGTHGGEKKIGHALDEAFRQGGRLPHIVLTAHVHDYQRFSRVQTLGPLTREIPYIVAGAGGYAGYDGLHEVHPDLTFEAGVSLEKYCDEWPGFLTIRVTADTLQCDYYTVPPPPRHAKSNNPATLFDSITIAR